MHLVRTDLPAPLSPQRAVTCPAGRSRSTPYRAWTAPKCLLMPRSLSSGSVLADAIFEGFPPTDASAGSFPSASTFIASSFEIWAGHAVRIHVTLPTPERVPRYSRVAPV